MGILGGYNAESVTAADRLGGLNKSSKTPGRNDQYDAFRHAYTSALFTGEFGVTIAKWLGDKNEEPYDPNGKHKGMTQQQYHAEKNMDLWNNNLGRQEYQNWEKATEAGTTTDLLDKWIYDRVKEGATINDLLDNRVWTEPQSESDTYGRNHSAPFTEILPAAWRRTKYEHQGKQEVQQGYIHETSVRANQDWFDNDSWLSVEEEERERQQIVAAPQAPNTNGDDTQLIDEYGNTYTLYYMYCKRIFLTGRRLKRGRLFEMFYYDQDSNNLVQMVEIFWPSNDSQGNSEGRFIISSRIESGRLLQRWYHEHWPVNDNPKDGACSMYFCSGSCDMNDYDDNGNRKSSSNRLVEPLDEADEVWNELSVWLNPDYYNQSQINGANAGNVDSIVQEELNSFGEANRQAATAGEATPNQPHDDSPLLHPDTFISYGQISYGQDPHCCDALSDDDNQSEMVDFRDTVWSELKVWFSASAPVSPLVESLVAFTPRADGQVRFSSEWHTGLTLLMAAGWQ